MSKPPQERRTGDPAIRKVMDEVKTLKADLQKNNEVTNEVRDILTSMKMLASFAKWITVVAGGITVFVNGISWLKVR